MGKSTTNKAAQAASDAVASFSDFDLFAPPGDFVTCATEDVCALARSEFEALCVPREAVPATQLLATMRRLAPFARVEAGYCQIATEEEYTRDGDMFEVQRVNASALLVHFAFVALAFVEAGAQAQEALCDAGGAS